MTRRTFLPAAAALPALAANVPQSGLKKHRLKQSVSRWCFDKFSLDELCARSVRLGLKGIDLVGSEEWPVVQRHGLVPTMAPGAATIEHGLNRKENHAKLEQEFRENIRKAAAAGVPNVITFSGNRRDLSAAEGLENCVIGLDRVKRIAEDAGVTINLELLNSKVDHKDYQCDHTAWGTEICKRVNSPRVKLLYDIYHMQIMEGDVIRTIRENIQWIGHFHTGGNPGRNEIDASQELNYRAIAKAIADLNFAGYIAHEFVPTKKDPFQSLAEAVAICDV